MDEQEFLGEVQRRAGLASVREAEATTGATLTALGEYLVGYEGLDLASRLPEGLATTLRREPPDRPQIISLNDFLFRVGEEEGTDPDDDADPTEALPRARAVMSVVLEAVAPDEAEDLRLQFPSEFAPLFE
ncbi:DUF2267 domain-containing protein [Rubrobacter marinus]|uniref:DUF2267 domain-containing protein n=1 Tax=Rubrobacter marinus TaxID=2653852 RepID=A0A6G8Q0E0_9ACTN|nr:DUF2267 domain-containing protein [Rubrobacter marinus]QIN79915.1 DUF2267 domain-containing protein [Rubrobacter marinus]